MKNAFGANGKKVAGIAVMRTAGIARTSIPVRFKASLGRADGPGRSEGAEFRVADPKRRSVPLSAAPPAAQTREPVRRSLRDRDRACAREIRGA